MTAAQIIASPDGVADRLGLTSPGHMTQSTASLRIGTRGSPCMVQARTVRSRLAAALGADEGTIELIVIRTTGDAIRTAHWWKKVEPVHEGNKEALLDGYRSRCILQKICPRCCTV